MAAPVSRCDPVAQPRSAKRVETLYPFPEPIESEVVLPFMPKYAKR